MITLQNQDNPNWNDLVLRLLNETGLNQKDLGEKIGVHRSTINILAAGEKKPQLSYVVGYKLVKAYHDYVIGSCYMEFKA